MLTLLLDKSSAPLNRLALHRLQLDAGSPSVTLDTEGRETLLYALVGSATVSVNGQSLGALGGRRSVTERLIHAVRTPAGMQAEVRVSVQGYAADLLWVTCATVKRSSGKTGGVPYVHRGDAVWHDVGTGCYRRTVAEVPTPAGYELHCGETLSDGVNGCWSSWPSHAAPEELERYADHEECFFCLTSGYMLMREDGKYCTGEEAKGVREIQNGDALATPLCSHEISSSPGDVGYYAWLYLSFLKKQYNKFSDQSIKKVYIK